MRQSDAWKATTPEPLQPAIAHIRKTFDDILWALTRSQDNCHAAIITPKRALREPVIFLRCFSDLRASVCDLVSNTFDLALKVASKNVAQEPIEWARSQVEFMLDDELLRSEATKIRQWIAFACDGSAVNREPPDLDTAAFEAWLFLRDWQSPAWLHMKPLGNTLYDPDTAWERDSVERSQRILGVHSSNFALALENTLKNAVGTAHVRCALTKGSHSSATDMRNEVKTAFADLKRKSKRPPKKEETSRWAKLKEELPDFEVSFREAMDRAKLTDRQYVCYSLRKEGQLSSLKVAKRVGITHQAVDKHVSAASDRMERFHENEKRRRRSAGTNV